MSSSTQNDLESEQNNLTHTNTAVEIIEPPPEVRVIVESVALTVSEMGLEFEKKMKTKNARERKLNFLMSSDHPYHAYYQHKLKEYFAAAAAKQKEQEAKGPEKILWDPPQPMQLSVEHHKAAYRQVPEGTTVKEIDIMRITAQFVARFGPQFWDDLKVKMSKDPRFDFMDNNNMKSAWFWMLRTPYSESLMCRAKKPRESDAYMATVFECFSLFLQRVEENDYGEKREEMNKYDWLDFMCGMEWKDFADNPSMMLMTLTTKKPAVYSDV